MGQNMLVFHNDSNTSYANYAGNLSSMSSATTAVTLNFASTVGTSASNDSVVLTVTAGQEENVMEAVNSFEHSLNVLLEYNNETVLMTQERGNPVHFPNLMLAQGRAPLPSQEDAYLQS